MGGNVQSGMHALTLWQPWATLIAEGVKVFETRSWKPPKNLIGQRIAIHAAKKKPTREEIDNCPPAIRSEMEKLYGFTNWWETIPYGTIIATTTITSFFYVQEVDDAFVRVKGLRTDETQNGTPGYLDIDIFGDYSPGRYAWRLSDVSKEIEPIPAKGKLGLWVWKRDSDDENRGTDVTDEEVESL